MRVLGIDYGTKRVGVSMGDSEARVAVPLEVIEVHSLQFTVHRIVELVRKENIELVVMGQGGSGPMEKKVQEFSAELRKVVPVEIVDEHFTTAQVERVMKDYGKDRKKIDKDSAAAALILQAYFDRV